MDLKSQQYNAPEKHAAGNLHAKGDPYSIELPEKHHAAEKVRDVRINVQLNRVRKFKKTAAESVWYQDLLIELLKRKISRKPLVLYMNGKQQKFL